MTQAELNREVASRTGESVSTIRRLGFNLLDIPCRPPLVVDWDQLDRQRPRFLPDRQRDAQLAPC
jgi:hypothetical protein